MFASKRVFFHGVGFCPPVGTMNLKRREDVCFDVLLKGGKDWWGY